VSVDTARVASTCTDTLRTNRRDDRDPVACCSKKVRFVCVNTHGIYYSSREVMVVHAQRDFFNHSAGTKECDRGFYARYDDPSSQAK
jgi:hypothetical protein